MNIKLNQKYFIYYQNNYETNKINMIGESMT